MVRLVFRPYTQIRRTICTSVSLRASTRVSPGFTLFRHRSPSFGSLGMCSYSKSLTGSVDSAALRLPTYYFHCAPGFYTQILAHAEDSLVRVSRRVNENRIVSITSSRANQRVHRREIKQSTALSNLGQHSCLQEPNVSCKNLNPRQRWAHGTHKNHSLSRAKNWCWPQPRLRQTLRP